MDTLEMNVNYSFAMERIHQILQFVLPQECVNPDDCQCSNGYTGLECEYSICFNKNATDIDVCSSHGDCTAPDTCHCDNGYTGSDCNVPICFNIPANETQSVCHGRGNCVAPDECICSNGYVGEDCSFIKCFGHNTSAPITVCTGNGDCVAPDDCQCLSTYVGEDCDTPVCYGVSAANQFVCSGNGRCSHPDYCECTQDYTGLLCNISVCYGVAADSIGTVCSGHGTCTSPNQCVCDNGFTGNDCSKPICFGIVSANSSVCSTHGDCVAPDTCSCNSNYISNDCRVPLCYGHNASDVAVCSGHGACIASDNCTCNSNYYGNDCSSYNCYGIISTSVSVCGKHGQCVSPDNCNCKVNYTGSECTFPSCYGTPATVSGVCSGNGTCTAVDTCSCNQGYSGAKCDNIVCYGKPHTDSTVCTGHGTCIAPNKCICNSSFVGSECDIPICYGIPSLNTATCSGNGRCASPNNCVCNSGYGGSVCNIPVCYGVLATDELVCSSHGQCISANKCNCSAGYYGVSCNETRIINQVTPSAASDGATVSVIGSSFTQGSDIVCKFEHVDRTTPQQYTSVGVWISSANVSCAVPQIPNTYNERMAVTLEIDGVTYESQGSIAFIVYLKSFKFQETFDKLNVFNTIFKTTGIQQPVVTDLGYDKVSKRSLIQITSETEQSWTLQTISTFPISDQQGLIEFKIDNNTTSTTGNLVELSLYLWDQVYFTTSISKDSLNSGYRVDSSPVTTTDNDCSIESGVFYALTLKLVSAAVSSDSRWHMVSQLASAGQAVCLLDITLPVSTVQLNTIVGFQNFTLLLSHSPSSASRSLQEVTNGSVIVDVDRVAVECQPGRCGVTDNGSQVKNPSPNAAKIAVGSVFGAIGLLLLLLLIILIIIIIVLVVRKKLKNTSTFRPTAMLETELDNVNI
jgi:hypothetical protein